MIEFKEIINLKAAVVGAVLLTALSGLVSDKADGAILIPGVNYSAHHTHPDSDGGATAVDPPPGTFFDGRITIRYNRKRVASIDEFGWFGAFSNQPGKPFLETGDGIFADADIPANLLPPNESLSVSVCDVLDGIPIKCSFDPFSPLELPISSEPNPEPPTGPIPDQPTIPIITDIDLVPENEEEDIFSSPQDFVAEDDFLVIDFDFGERGLTIDTEKSFNFFGFSYQFNQEAFDDKVVGISLVESGTGDIGLVPLEGFNIINCISQGSPESDIATDRCGEPTTPLDVSYITDAVVLTDSNNPGFVYDSTKKEGTLSNGNPFQLFDDSFLVGETVDEPHNNLGLLALGAFGVNLILKRRKKHQQSS